VIAAPAPRAAREVRLLEVGTSIRDHRHADLPSLLEPGDLLVVNDAATLPAALPATLGDRAIEVRLAGEVHPSRTRAVLFGSGTWRDRTEDRPPPPDVTPGDTLRFLGGLTATIVEDSPISPRLVTLAFDRGGEPLLRAIYAAGRPVQYAYARAALPLWAVQTPFAARPWAVEAPSAGHPLSWETLLALRTRGVALARLTHAAGLSSTGDPALDAALPLPERYDIPPETVRAIAGARRVIAAGTTVVRALEGATARRGALVAGSGTTDLRIGPGTPIVVVHAVLTGMHVPGESHYELLRAFADEITLARAADHAARAGYLSHEFGDAMLVHFTL
jgi:S-adenosylmethionine:tRNA ribosyltransferase-isomerase